MNLTSAALLTRAALPALRVTGGTVVFVNSGQGLNASPGWSAYAVSKFGLRAFADALRAEEAEHGVRVTTVFPGRTATPMQEKVHEQEGKEYDAADWSAPETVAADDPARARSARGLGDPGRDAPTASPLATLTRQKLSDGSAHSF